MIPRRVYPIESWEMVWNSEEVNSGEGNIMGVKKYPWEENEENQGWALLKAIWMIVWLNSLQGLVHLYHPQQAVSSFFDLLLA